MAIKANGKKKAVKAISKKRVVLLITGSEDGGTTILDDYLYVDQEQRIRELVKNIGPLPAQPKEKLDCFHTNFLDEGKTEEQRQHARYQRAADKLVAFMEDENTPEGLKDALNEAVLDFVNKNDGWNTGVEVAKFQLAHACVKAAASAEAD